jgi:hypothetical protein
MLKFAAAALIATVLAACSAHSPFIRVADLEVGTTYPDQERHLDWAVVRLERRVPDPIRVMTFRYAEDELAEAVPDQLTLVAYHADRFDGLALTKTSGRIRYGHELPVERHDQRLSGRFPAVEHRYVRRRELHLVRVNDLALERIAVGIAPLQLEGSGPFDRYHHLGGTQRHAGIGMEGAAAEGDAAERERAR